MDTQLQKYYSRCFGAMGSQEMLIFFLYYLKILQKKILALYNRKKCFDIKGKTAKIWRVGRSLFMIL